MRTRNETIQPTRVAAQRRLNSLNSNDGSRATSGRRVSCSGRKETELCLHRRREGMEGERVGARRIHGAWDSDKARGMSERGLRRSHLLATSDR